MMKKTLLSLAAVVATAFVAIACDTGSNITPCTADNEADVCDAAQICAIPAGETEGSCITPECESDLDCDLQNVGDDSPIYSKDEITAPATTCEDEDAVTIVAFDGIERCAIATEGQPCTDGNVAVDATKAAGGTVEICAKDDGVCSEDTASCS